MSVIDKFLDVMKLGGDDDYDEYDDYDEFDDDYEDEKPEWVGKVHCDERKRKITMILTRRSRPDLR